jgi:hypothetical protein
VLALALVGACVAVSWPADSPLVPGIGGRLSGSHRWAWTYLGCECAAFLAYAFALLLLERRAAAVTPVAALAAAIQLVPVGAPLLLSSDAWTYWDYGRIAAVHGGNPYRDTPADFSADPAFPYVGEDWRRTTSVYGPLFTLASEPVALAAGASPDAAAWIYKTLAAVAMLGVSGLAALLARRPAFACAFVGWNPLLALHFGGGGHNDAWMAALILAALALAASGRRQWAGGAWAAAVFVKWIPLLFLPLRALEARASGRRVAHLGLAAVTAAVALVSTWQFGWRWLGAFGPLARTANHETRFALPHRLASLGVPDDVALGLLLAGFALAYLALLRQASAGRARLALTAGLLLLATPYLAPWYVVWVLPLAGMEEDRTAQLLALALCAYLLPQTVPL